MRVDTETKGETTLWIKVDQENAATEFSQGSA
jgi:hypothetical protein